MVYEYHSPVGTLPFIASKDSKQRAEIWTKLPTIPAASVAKVVCSHCMSLSLIDQQEPGYLGLLPYTLFALDIFFCNGTVPGSNRTAASFFGEKAP